MDNYQKSLVKEHSELVVNINKLTGYINSKKSSNDDRAEFANKIVQLKAMVMYEEALGCRLANSGVVYEDGQYYERVAHVDTIIPPTGELGQGNDFDKDTEDLSKTHNITSNG